MRNFLFAHEMPQRVLELHLLNEKIVLRIQSARMHWTLQVERKPLRNPAHSGALREVEKNREIEHDGRGENRITAQEIHLDLHRIAQPSKDVDVIPALLVVAMRRV